jgi:sulfate adenylyltransferase
MTGLIPPHGASLRQLLPNEADGRALRTACRDLPSWDLTPGQLCDVEQILTGAYSPIEGFLTESVYAEVLENARIPDSGIAWSWPVVLDVATKFAAELHVGSRVALRDAEGLPVAILDVSDIWEGDRAREAQTLFDDPEDPAAIAWCAARNPMYLGGPLTGIELPPRFDYPEHRRAPSETRALFERMGWTNVLAYQSDDFILRPHHHVVSRCCREREINLLLNLELNVAAPPTAADIAKIESFRCAHRHFIHQRAELNLLPSVAALPGRRALLHRLCVQKNYGCSSFLVVGDASCSDEDFVAHVRDAYGVELFHAKNVDWDAGTAAYVEVDGEMDHALEARLSSGDALPDWLVWPELVPELTKAYPAKDRQGFTILFTGLSGAGKSTVARTVMAKLMAIGDARQVTLLDGDVVRKHLSSELGWSREHRDLNILRIGYVAREITKHRGIAICAPIAPYRETRREVRNMVEAHGGFIEVHVATPLEICEERDRKGLYAKARSGLLPSPLTGVSDPYEVPESPELRLDTAELTPEEAAQAVLLKLEHLGYLRP